MSTTGCSTYGISTNKRQLLLSQNELLASDAAGIASVDGTPLATVTANALFPSVGSLLALYRMQSHPLILAIAACYEIAERSGEMMPTRLIAALNAGK